MNFGTVFIVTIIILLPGLLWSMADRAWGNEKNPPFWVMFVKATLFGAFAYSMLAFGFKLIDMVIDIPISIENPILKLGEDFKPVDYELEVLLSLPTTLGLAILWFYAEKYQWISKFLYKIRAVTPLQEKSLMATILENPKGTIRKVCVWDNERDFLYFGKLMRFIEEKELVKVYLEEVTICNLEGEVIRKTDQFIYTCPVKDFKIEITNQEENTNA